MSVHGAASPSGFPWVRPLAVLAPELPMPLTRFVGREAELDQAADLLAEARLLTLTGPGGCGKTRLAIELAAEKAEDFPHGVWFVDLSPLSGGEFVLGEVAMTLAVKEPGRGKTLAEAVGRHLAPRQALMVLDNCEHVVAAAAEVTAGLLAAAPALKVVATSREPLAVGGEVTWAVPPLSEADAVELFAERARQARPDFTLREEDDAAVRSICRRLDGLPLAIELAAARARALAPARIAAHLRDRFSLLPGGPRTAPPRQATLRASFEWSYELLSESERAVLRQLAVFAGGFEVDAALAVCPAATIDLLVALVDRSLLAVDNTAGRGEPRYRMLETIRQFAAERLAEAGEGDLLRSRHRDHYLELAEAAEPGLEGPDQSRWLIRLAGEQDNLRVALAWSRDQGEAEALARLVLALSSFWGIRGQMTQARLWLEAASARAAAASPAQRARMSNLQCFLAISSGSVGEVPALANEALDLARASGDKREEAFARFNLGLMTGLVGGAEAMRPYIEEALPLARSAGFAHGTLLSLLAFIALRWFQSDPEEPRRLAEEAIAIAKAGGDRHFVLWATWAAGVTALVQGRLADADAVLVAVVADGRQTDDTVVMYCLLCLAWVRMLQGDFAAARTAATQSLAAAQSSEGDTVSVAMIDTAAKWIVGWMQMASGDAAQATGVLDVVVQVARSSLIPRLAALPLVVLAEAQLALGSRDQAGVSLDEACSIAQSSGLTWVLGRAGLVRAKLRGLEGESDEAESLVHEAFRHQRDAGDQIGLADGLELVASLAAGQDSAREAVRLWAAAETLRAELGYARIPADRPAYEAAIAHVKEAVGPDDFAALWAEGAQLSPEAAIAYAARGRGERRRPTSGWASLTPSELAVVRLVGQHLSNPEIATRLFVSRATVKTHLIHVFGKLGISSRSELVAEAIRRGLDKHPGGRPPAAPAGASNVRTDSRAR